MKNTNNVSQFMLEMYHLGAVSAKERRMVEKALSADKELSLRYEALKQSNRELNRQYPFENLPVLQGFGDTATPIPATSVSTFAGGGLSQSFILGWLVPAVIAGAVFVAVINTEGNFIERFISANSVQTVASLEEPDLTPKRRHFPIVSAGVSAVGVSYGEVSSSYEIDPYDVHTYNNRGLVFYAGGDYDSALEDFNRALELALADYEKAVDLDSYIHVYNNRGLVFYAEGDYDSALEDFDKAIELDPNYIHAYNNRGIVLYALKKYDRAIEDYTKAIELDLDHDYAFAYNNRGIVSYFRKDYNNAIKDYTEAIRIDPDYARSYYNLGNAYYGLKNYNRAIENYTEVVTRLDPGDASAYNNRGSAYLETKDFDSAIADFDQALAINPGHANAKDNREMAYRAKEMQGSKQ